MSRLSAGVGAVSDDCGALRLHGADGYQAECGPRGHSHRLRGHRSRVYSPCGTGRFNTDFLRIPISLRNPGEKWPFLLSQTT